MYIDYIILIFILFIGLSPFIIAGLIVAVVYIWCIILERN